VPRQIESASPRPRPGPKRKPGPRPKTVTSKRGSSSHASGVAKHGERRRRVAHRPDRSTPSSKPTRQKAPRTEGAPATTAKWWLLVAIVLVTGFAVAVLEAPFFEARSVQVSGIARTSEGAVLDALDLQPDQALLRYDTTRAAELVAELPWVKQVEISRQWPSTVRIVVRERSVTSAIGTPTGSRWLVLGEEGYVVEERYTPPTGVPVILATTSIVESAAIGEQLGGVERVLEIANDLPLQLDPWVTTWSTDDEGRVTAHLVGSATVEFGAFEDHRTQFVSLASILNGGAPLVCLRTLDLSVADTPVLYRDPACLLEAAELS